MSPVEFKKLQYPLSVFSLMFSVDLKVAQCRLSILETVVSPSRIYGSRAMIQCTLNLFQIQIRPGCRIPSPWSPTHDTDGRLLTAQCGQLSSGTFCNTSENAKKQAQGDGGVKVCVCVGGGGG